jgi:NitT/TauT family transport system permease protein
MGSALLDLLKDNNFWPHIFTTLYEVSIAFIFGITIGFFIAIMLYELPFLAEIFDPFLTMLNSLPKVALGPLIIIIAGANTKSIIMMALLINLIVNIITIYNGFLNTDKSKIKLFDSLKATKIQKLIYLVIPGSFNTIISSLKLNISMSLIGVIMGEFLVSKKGIGYLIIYGTQIFNLDLVMLGILVLAIISFILYEMVYYLEKKLLK